MLFSRKSHRAGRVAPAPAQLPAAGNAGKDADGATAVAIETPAEPGGSSNEAHVLALAIEDAGLGGAALFALQALKPLHWLGGQAAWALQPFVDSFGAGRGRGRGRLTAHGIAGLLEREGGVDDLVAQLEALRGGRVGRTG